VRSLALPRNYFRFQNNGPAFAQRGRIFSNSTSDSLGAFEEASRPKFITLAANLSVEMKVIDVLGTPLTVTTYSEFTKYCQDLAGTNKTYAVDLTNTQIVAMRRHEPGFAEITSRFDHFVPDGMPLIWCLNRKGGRLETRVYGPTFMRHCILNSPAPFTHYLLGGSNECIERLRIRFTELNPDVRIIGSHHGFFEKDEQPALLDEINRLSPDFIWVGLGTPKQQRWIHETKPRLRKGVLFAVGFAFDVNAGLKPDAPAWMQRFGLTWVYRIWSEPRRLLRRYLRYNTLFVYYLTRDGLRSQAIRS
jgi:N-acetylglucosaminyldiphosphoundecaprenol N-acetyl-beta-D-mannosaminyltransferase